MKPKMDTLMVRTILWIFVFYICASFFFVLGKFDCDNKKSQQFLAYFYPFFVISGGCSSVDGAHPHARRHARGSGFKDQRTRGPFSPCHDLCGSTIPTTSSGMWLHFRLVYILSHHRCHDFCKLTHTSNKSRKFFYMLKTHSLFYRVFVRVKGQENNIKTSTLFHRNI